MLNQIVDLFLKPLIIVNGMTHGSFMIFTYSIFVILFKKKVVGLGFKVEVLSNKHS
jgi:hypothetical protein